MGHLSLKCEVLTGHGLPMPDLEKKKIKLMSVLDVYENYCSTDIEIHAIFEHLYGTFAEEKQQKGRNTKVNVKQS